MAHALPFARASMLRAWRGGRDRGHCGPHADTMSHRISKPLVRMMFGEA
jgi:hypothetical protein